MYSRWLLWCFLVLDVHECRLRLKLRPFISVATIQDRDSEMTMWSRLCVCVCVHTHGIMGGFYRANQRSRHARWDTDNCVSVSTKWNGYFTPHWPDIQLPSVQCAFVPGVLPACRDSWSYLKRHNNINTQSNTIECNVKFNHCSAHCRNRGQSAHGMDCSCKLVPWSQEIYLTYHVFHGEENQSTWLEPMEP